MVRSGRQDTRLAGVALLRESAGRIDHASFSQQREAWATMLLPMLQASEDAALRLSAAATLLRLLAVSAPWPLERRELASCAPRLMSTLLALLEDQAASQVDEPRPGRRRRRPTHPGARTCPTHPPDTPSSRQASDVQAEASLLLIQLACEDSVLP